MSYLAKIKRISNQSVIFPWLILFVILNLIITGEGGQNETARMVMMKSMYENKSFKINDYIHLTDDWARTPDGSYYSNKLPGPSLIGFPLFTLIELLSQKLKKDYDETTKPGYWHRVFLSFFMQIFPLSLLLFFFSLKAKENTMGIHFFTLALLFGNTASSLMNVYMGHGMALTFLLASLYFLEEKKFWGVGASLGIAVLTDFSAALALPFVLIFIALINKEKLIKVGKEILIGAFVPFVLWCWYHISCYGSPFKTANNFPNPTFVKLYGNKDVGDLIFQFIPKLSIIFELVLGGSRGILWTQPWALIVMFFGGFLLIKKRLSKENVLLFLMTFLILLSGIIVNSMFLGWHGGASPGPRYIVPLMAFVAYFGFKVYPLMSKGIRKILWVSVAFSIVFKGLVLSTSILLPDENLWVYMIEKMIKHPTPTPWLRIIIFVVLFGFTFRWIARRK